MKSFIIMNGEEIAESYNLLSMFHIFDTVLHVCLNNNIQCSLVLVTDDGVVLKEVEVI